MEYTLTPVRFSGTTSPTAGSARPHAVSSISGTVNTSYTYDNNGNTLTGNGRTLTWTSYNMAATIVRGTNTLTFSYGPEQRRIKQVAPGGTTLYSDGFAPVEKFTATGGATQWANYIYAAGGIVAVYYEKNPGPSVTRYFHKDHLASVNVITDESGTVVERLAYDAWGKRRFPNGAPDPTESIVSLALKGFTEHDHLPEVGLVDMNARVYDPQVARFLSADSIVPGAIGSQGHNRYSYVLNGPLSAIDPTGYAQEETGDDRQDGWYGSLPSDPGYSDTLVNHGDDAGTGAACDCRDMPPSPPAAAGGNTSQGGGGTLQLTEYNRKTGGFTATFYDPNNPRSMAAMEEKQWTSHYLTSFYPTVLDIPFEAFAALTRSQPEAKGLAPGVVQYASADCIISCSDVASPTLAQARTSTQSGVFIIGCGENKCGGISFGFATDDDERRIYVTLHAGGGTNGIAFGIEQLINNQPVRNIPGTVAEVGAGGGFGPFLGGTFYVGPTDKDGLLVGGGIVFGAGVGGGIYTGVGRTWTPFELGPTPKLDGFMGVSP